MAHLMMAGLQVKDRLPAVIRHTAAIKAVFVWVVYVV